MNSILGVQTSLLPNTRQKLNDIKGKVMKIFCTHKWKVLSDTVTKSAFELVKEAGVSEIKGGGLFQRKHIVIVCCDKCGKIKRFVDSLN